MLFDPECARAVAAVGGTSAGASSHRAQTEVSLDQRRVAMAGCRREEALVQR